MKRGKIVRLTRFGWALVTGWFCVGAVAHASDDAALAHARKLLQSAILVDGVMPNMDGPAVIRRIRLDAGLRTTPCLLLTATDHAGAELAALDAGADAFVRKDEDVAVVLARLAAVLRGSGQRAEAPGPARACRVLAVDDDPTSLADLAELLRGEGYDAVLASSGEEALELLAAQTVDCILLDVVMPGLGGHETCFAWGYGGQYVFVVPSLQVVIATTSSTDVSEERRGHRRQLVDVLTRLVVAPLTAAVTAP